MGKASAKAKEKLDAVLNNPNRNDNSGKQKSPSPAPSPSIITEELQLLKTGAYNARQIGTRHTGGKLTP